MRKNCKSPQFLIRGGGGNREIEGEQFKGIAGRNGSHETQNAQQGTRIDGQEREREREREIREKLGYLKMTFSNGSQGR